MMSPFPAGASHTGISDVADAHRRRRSPRTVLPHAVLAAGVCLACMVSAAPGGSALAQNSNQNSNLTRQTQQARITIPLPSLAPLVERVSPAVVNISVTMNREAAQNEAQNEDEGPGFPPSPFDELLRRFFEQQGVPRPNMPVP